MTTAENYEILINGARNGREFSNMIERAKCEAIAEEYVKEGTLSALEFGDGSRIEVGSMQGHCQSKVI
jgi:hypothetical protein